MGIAISPVTTTTLAVIPPLALPDAAGLAYASGDVRHLSIEDPLNTTTISNATRNLAYRDNLLANAVNELISIVNNQENLIQLPAVWTYLAPGQSFTVTNYRIPAGYEARVLDATVTAIPVGSVMLQVLYSANTYGQQTGISVASTYSEYTGGTSFYGTGEFILVLTNAGTTGSETTASVLVSLRPVVAQTGSVLGPGVTGQQGPIGPIGPTGPTGIGVPGAPGSPGLNWRGNFSLVAAYNANDAVSYNFGTGVGTASFVCLIACTGIAPPLPTLAPSTNWSLLAYASPLFPVDVIAPLFLSGTVTQGTNPFGYFLAPYAGQAVSATSYVQFPPYGGSVTIDLVSSGSKQGTPISISNGQFYSGTTFVNPINLISGQALQAQVTYLGGSVAGNTLTYNLVFQAVL